MSSPRLPVTKFGVEVSQARPSGSYDPRSLSRCLPAYPLRWQSPKICGMDTESSRQRTRISRI